MPKEMGGYLCSILPTVAIGVVNRLVVIGVVIKVWSIVTTISSWSVIVAMKPIGSSL